jgi:hypothetical protein
MMSYFVTFIILMLIVIIASVVTARVRRTLRYIEIINRYPDEAYDHFMSAPDLWLVYECATPELIPNAFPDASRLPQGKLLGPFCFKVPKLQSRMITVYGKSINCLRSLDLFVYKMKIQRTDNRHSEINSSGK